MNYFDIKDLYNAKSNPAVKDGRKSERQALQGFHHAFEMNHEGTGNFKISVEEWLDYYTNVSASIRSDTYFEQLINSSWNLDGKAAMPQKQVSWGNDFNPRPSNHGDQKHYSGKESQDLNMHASSSYHADRSSPIRKSMAYTAPKRDFGYTETPGLTTNGLSMGNKPELYQEHIQKKQTFNQYSMPYRKASDEK